MIISRTAAAAAACAHTPRFRAEAHRLPPLVREQLLPAMASMGALATRPATELDWHRILDTVVLLCRPGWQDLS
jgi:hypothetical protein